VFFQIFLVLLGVPTITLVLVRIRREARERDELLRDFERNNRQYLFNPGTEEDRKVKAQEIIGNSIENLKHASSFIKNITSGNYAVEWSGINEKNAALNKENVVGHLMSMRDEMKRVKKEDQERLWATEGLAQFSEIVRNNQNSVSELTNAVVRFLTQYLKAQQGSLFVLNEDEGGEVYLSLASCFAFDKKKFIEKKIDLGSGLIGQACIDGNTILLTEIPQRYVSITSGLGEATPNCLLIVPMKYNEKVECAFEIASFSKFEQYQISFLEKAGEFVASAIYSVRSTEHTSNLLKAAQENTEMMRSQEEEMRQNMEELQATQEEMARKESESARILEECRANEKILKKKLEELQKSHA
jgi:transcriptional regulator with GAF, ATPase, and Fis domain